MQDALRIPIVPVNLVLRSEQHARADLSSVTTIPSQSEAIAMHEASPGDSVRRSCLSPNRVRPVFYTLGLRRGGVAGEIGDRG